jgi:hypothetical protein
VADTVFAAVRERRLYVLPHPQFVPQVQQRAESIVAGGPPLAPGVPQPAARN